MMGEKRNADMVAVYEGLDIGAVDNTKVTTL